MNRFRSLQRDRVARRRPRRSISFEGLEERTLLTTAAGLNIASAIPLTAPSDTVIGAAAVGAPVFYQIDPAVDSLLVANVAGSRAALRLDLLDAQGQLLLTSDGDSAVNPDPQIVQHLGSGTDFLEVESRDGSGGFALTMSLTPSSMPGQPVTLTFPTANPPAPPPVSLPSSPLPPISIPSAPTVPSTTSSTASPPAPVSSISLPPTPASYPVYPLSADADGVVTGDFFGHGWLDVAAITEESDPSGPSLYRSIALAPNMGDGTFGSQVSLSLGNLEPLALAAGDFTSDGNTDLAVAGYLVNAANQVIVGSNRVEVFPGLGNGTFGAPVTTLLGDTIPVQLDTGIFRNDGHLGLAVAGEVPSIVGPDGTIPISQENSLTKQYRVVILAGRGNGTFDQTDVADLDNPDTFSGPLLQVGDFMGSGVADLAYVSLPSNGDEDLVVIPNRGDGTFSNPVLTPLADYEFTCMAAGHFSGSGRLDLAFSTAEFGTSALSVVILDNEGGGRFGPAQTYASGLPYFSYNYSMLVGDFSGTGRDDIAVSWSTAALDFEVAVLQNGGDLGFHWSSNVGQVSGESEEPILLASGDFTADGRTDVLVGEPYGSIDGSVQFQVVAGRGDGTFATGSSALTDLSQQGSPPSGALGLAGLLNGEYIATGDFNGDGLLDAAYTSTDGSNDFAVNVQLGNGDGTLDAPVTIPLGLIYPRDLLVGDFTANGRTDLLVSGRVLVYDPFNIGDIQIPEWSPTGPPVLEMIPSLPGGRFGAPELINTDLSQISQVITGNFTGDGGTDIAVTGQTSGPESQNVVEVIAHQPDGSFATFASISQSPYDIDSLAAGDFTGTGRTDLIVAEHIPAADATNSAAVSSRIVLLSNEGAALFQESTVEELGNLSVISIVAADLSGDGHLDLAYLATDNPPPSTNPDVPPPFPQESVSLLNGDGEGHFLPVATAINVGDDLPFGMETADFDGDGRADLFIESAFSFNVLINLGNDAFTPPITVYPFGSLTGNAATGDFNGDGRDDLVTDSGSSGAQVALSVGDGNFVPPAQLNSESHDNPVVADVGGDGVEDVLVTNSSGDILYRQGRASAPGTFDPAVVVNPGNPSSGIALVPMKSASLIASIDKIQNAVSLYRFQDGQFIPAGSLPTGDYPVQVVAGDLDGNGMSDIVVRNLGGGTATIYYGDGSGGFVRGPDVPIGTDASDIALVPRAGTGLMDLAVTDQSSGTVQIWSNQGNGTFLLESDYQAGAGPYGTVAGGNDLASLEATAGVAAGAFGPSGQPALAVINPGSNTLGLLDEVGGNSFANSAVLPSPSSGQVIVAGNFQGDGVTDFAVLSSQGVDVYLGNGAGGFLPPTHYDAGLDPTGLTVADVTGNGIADLVVGDASGDTLVLLGNGHGGFAPYHDANQQIALTVAGAGSGASGPEFVLASAAQSQVAVQVGGKLQTLGGPADGLQSPSAVVMADLNGDGIPDLVVVNSGANSVLVYPGLGNGKFGPAESFPVGTDPVAVAVGDLTGNGMLDLAVANQGSNDVSILMGSGHGSSWTLTPGPRIQAGFDPTAIAIADATANGIPDLLVSDGAAGQVRLIPGVGGGFFNDADPTLFNVGVDPGALFLGSFVGNPDSLDLVVLNAGSNDLTLIRGINLGDDAEQTISSGGLFPSSAVMGEFDGRLGLLVANNGDGRLALFLAGSEGLTSAGVFSQADLPNPTSLAMDSLGTIYGTTEGLESAIRVLIDVTPDSSAGGLAGLLETAQRPEDQLLTLIVALTASADPAEAEGPVPVQGSTTATEATGVGFANQPLPHSESPHELTLSSWDGPEPTLALRAVTEAGWDPVAWVVAGLDEAFQHASVTTLAAPTTASTASDSETPEPAAAATVIEAGTGSPAEAAGPSIPAQVVDSVESAPAEPPVQPLALSESSLFSPLAPAGSGEIWSPGRVVGLVTAGAAGLSWLLSDRLRSTARTSSLAKLLSSRLPMPSAASRRTKTI